MDAIVTARVPVETKSQGAEILRRLGETPTRLVNAAYEYLRATGALPKAPAVGSAYGVGSDQVARAEAFLAETTLEAPSSFWAELGDADYDVLLAEGRAAAYEALA
jgi:antitoxin component of RelBE/YafQ-DinJ toxin-antitoxin module